MGPEVRDNGSDDHDGKHSTIHQVGGIIPASDEANGEVDPDEDEGRHDCDTDGGSIQVSPNILAASTKVPQATASMAPKIAKSAASHFTSSVICMVNRGSSRPIQVLKKAILKVGA